MPWQWSAWSWVTITRSTGRDLGGEQLLAQVGAAIDQQALAAAFDQDRRAGAAVARLGGIAIAPVIADARNARRRPAAEDAEFHAAAFPNNRKKLAVVASAKCSKRLAAQIGDEGGGVGDEGRLAGLAAVRHRGEEGRIGFDQQPVVRDGLGGVLQVARRS